MVLADRLWAVESQEELGSILEEVLAWTGELQAWKEEGCQRWAKEESCLFLAILEDRYLAFP